MSRFRLVSIILFTFVIIKCHGFDFIMERKNFSLRGQCYCGIIRCQVDTVTDDKVSSLIKMDIYYLNNRTLLAAILSKDPEIQSHTRNKVNVTGSMSDHHGELRLYFTETADCMDAHFICRINFFLTSGQTDFSEKSTVSNSPENDGPDLYMKSQISYEQTISGQSGLIPKNLISPNDFIKNRMAFTLQTGNSDSLTPEKNIELTKNSLMSQTTNHEPDIKQVLSELESRMAYMFNISMTELLRNITNIYEHQENRNVIGMQQIEKKFQDNYNNSLLELNNKLNDLINKVEVCVTKKELTQGNDEQINITLLLESISKQQNNLLKNQETLRESFVNLSSTIRSLKLQEKDILSNNLKCERGMNSSLEPREVTTINSNIKTLCDTKTDGGGWIIIQRRVKGDTNFNVSWDVYKHGFGSLHGDFWLGNDVISNLTRTDRHILRIDMRCQNVDSFAVYDYFKVEDETQLYTLRLGAFYGNASDSFTYNKDMKFTTLDRDNDVLSLNCANNYYHNSGWWHKDCSYSNLNGVWGGKVSKNYIYWVHNKECSFVEMKLRKVAG